MSYYYEVEVLQPDGRTAILVVEAESHPDAKKTAENDGTVLSTRRLEDEP